jgi:hypothetical protein
MKHVRHYLKVFAQAFLVMIGIILITGVLLATFS